jgi:hypothetical protein
MASLNLFGRDRIVTDRLPAVCICCGEPATSLKEKRFGWYPRWLIVLLPLAWLPILIVIMLLRKTMTVRIPLCDEHRNLWFWFEVCRWAVIAGFVLGLFGLFAVMIALENLGLRQDLGGLFCVMLGSLVGGFLVLVIGLYVWGRRLVYVEEITDSSIRLGGVCEEFIDQYLAGDDDDEWSVRQRRRRADPYDED